MHATEFVRTPPEALPAFLALTGDQRHLKQQVIEQLAKQLLDDEDSTPSRFAGKEATWQQVIDELNTVSMWGDRRLVVVDDADEFVTQNRSTLEKLADKPPKKSVLILDVQKWPKTTRLAKQVAAQGGEIECSELKGPALSRWLTDTARDVHGAKLSRDAASLLIEAIGSELGVLDTELAKLAAYVGTGGTIEGSHVRDLVGGWKSETTWAMTDAVREDRLADALAALEDLLEDGEAPQKLMGGISFVFRKVALATELSRTLPFDQALRQSGLFPKEISMVGNYLRRIGRPKAERILQNLVEVDGGMKGGSRLPERLQLEFLLLRLAGRA